MSSSVTTRNALLVRGRGKQKLLYRQVADHLRRDIENGKLKPGIMIPSMDDLAERFQINKATVRQAIAQLIAGGLVYSVPAKGTFVSDQAPGRKAKSSARPLSIGWALNVGDNGNTGRYHTEIMDSVHAALQEINGHLLIVPARGLSTNALCRVVAEARVDGVILIGSYPHETIRHLADSGLPIALIDSVCRGARIDSILVDNRGGGYQAAEHLIALGHRNLAFVTGPADLPITADRLAGAWDAVDAAGLSRQAVQVVEGDFAPPSGHKAMMDLMARKPRPTGVFFFNDEMASGGLNALYEHFRAGVPGDLSVVGFDDIYWAALTHPPLTTVHVEKDLMAREAVQRLARALTQRNHVPTTTIVPTRLVVRRSTASPIQKPRR